VCTLRAVAEKVRVGLERDVGIAAILQGLDQVVRRSLCCAREAGEVLKGGAKGDNGSRAVRGFEELGSEGAHVEPANRIGNPRGAGSVTFRKPLAREGPASNPRTQHAPGSVVDAARLIAVGCLAGDPTWHSEATHTTRFANRETRSLIAFDAKPGTWADQLLKI
jgi:hypothetical protein